MWHNVTITSSTATESSLKLVYIFGTTCFGEKWTCDKLGNVCIVQQIWHVCQDLHWMLISKNNTSDVIVVWVSYLCIDGVWDTCLTGWWHREVFHMLCGLRSPTHSYPWAKMHVGLRSKCPLLLSHFNQNWNITHFHKIPQFQISWKSIQQFSSCYTQTDRETGETNSCIYATFKLWMSLLIVFWFFTVPSFKSVYLLSCLKIY
jgi:hypothetical protein